MRCEFSKCKTTQGVKKSQIDARKLSFDVYADKLNCWPRVRVSEEDDYDYNDDEEEEEEED